MMNIRNASNADSHMCGRILSAGAYLPSILY
jgi:hypothetical protein